MKHPFRFFALLFVVMAALAAAIIMTMRYMDVLQKQFDFLRGQLARRSAKTPRDGDFKEEFSEDNMEEDEPFPIEDSFDSGDLKF